MFAIGVSSEEYNKIIKGIKVYEFAINKDLNIMVGDYILFKKKPECYEATLTKVVEKKLFKDFDEMSTCLSLKELGFEGLTNKDVVDFCNKKYDVEKVKEYGVVVYRYEIA